MWLHQPAPPERLAAMRIAVGSFVTLYMAFNVREFDRLAARSSEGFAPIGLARVLDAPLSAAAIWVLFAALVLGGAAFTLGIAARVSGPAFATLVLFWTSYHSSWGQLLHFEHLFTLHVMILALAPTAEAWAPGAPDSMEPSARFGWPLRLLAIATAVTYVLSGIAKLRNSGWAWFDAETLATHIGYSATRMETIGSRQPPLAGAVLENQWAIPAMAAAALMIELGAPLALTTPRLRNIWVTAAVVFHAATAATMHVFFGYQGLAVAMLPLFAIERVPEYVRDNLARFHHRTVGPT